jgi:hypothetical protein
VTGDRVIRFATAAVVCAVAGFAAVGQLLAHLRLGRTHGQDGAAARLLPLSVDGLILAASLVLLHEARDDRDAPGMLWLGIGATVGANIAYGAGYGLLGALISAWPAVAFIGSVAWWWQLLDPWLGQPWYAEIEDFDAWLAEVRRRLAQRVDETVAVEQPVNVDRDHLPLAETDAEQQKRTGGDAAG